MAGQGGRLIFLYNLGAVLMDILHKKPGRGGLPYAAFSQSL